MKNVNEAVAAFINACKREKTRIESMRTPIDSIRPTIEIVTSSAFDGYMRGELFQFHFDHFNKIWGGRYADANANINTGKVVCFSPLYRGYPFNKEIKLAARLIKLVNRYGYDSVSKAIRAANDSFVQAA